MKKLLLPIITGMLLLPLSGCETLSDPAVFNAFASAAADIQRSSDMYTANNALSVYGGYPLYNYSGNSYTPSSTYSGNSYTPSSNTYSSNTTSDYDPKYSGSSCKYSCSSIYDSCFDAANHHDIYDEATVDSKITQCKTDRHSCESDC